MPIFSKSNENNCESDFRIYQSKLDFREILYLQIKNELAINLLNIRYDLEQLGNDGGPE